MNEIDLDLKEMSGNKYQDIWKNEVTTSDLRSHVSK